MSTSAAGVASATLASPITAGQPSAIASRPGRQLGVPAVEHLLHLVDAHRERRLRDLQDVAVEDVTTCHPRRPAARGDQQAQRGAVHQGVDELLARRGRGDVVVVVEHDPGVLRPLEQVVGQDLGQHAGLARRILRGRQPLLEASTGARDDLRRRGREPSRENRDVDRRPPSAVPGSPPPLLPRPLLGQDRLPVAGRGDQHPHSRLRPIEGADQPRTLDDPASPRCPRSGRLPHRDRGYSCAAHLRRRRPRMARARAAGAVPSGPGRRPATGVREGILTSEDAKRRRDVPPSRDAELPPQRVGMRLGRPWGDAERRSDLVVRAAGGDEGDDLALPCGQVGAGLTNRIAHGARFWPSASAGTIPRQV